jgi:polyisoprenoid-binding protein YceI
MSARKHISRIVLLVLAGSLASRVAADAPRAARYEADADLSKVYVKVGIATRLGHEHGVEGKLKSGKLTFGGEGELVFDMTSFTADTVAARKYVGLGDKEMSENEAKKVTEAMRSATVLNVEKYPTATFRIASITPLDEQAAGKPGMYRLEGKFTLHGTERKLQFKAKLDRTDKDGLMKLSGSFPILQTDYGIKPATAAGGVVKAADELTISGELFLRNADR